MKYLGGKQRLGKHLAPYIVNIWNTQKSNTELNVPELNGYLEPFCGSLGVFKHVANYMCNDLGLQYTPRSIVASDYHPDLIQMWKEVQSGDFVYPKSISESRFNAAKQLQSPSAMKAFVGFGMSFGGRFFGSYSHKYLGNKKEDFCAEMNHSLQRTQPMIKCKKVKFIQKDYTSWKPSKKLIYCDPPYEYHKYPIKYRRDVKHYDDFDNDEFWNVVRKWSTQGGNIVLVSEMNAPNDFVEIWNMEKYRSAAQSKKTRFKVKGASATQYVEKLYIHESAVM